MSHSVKEMTNDARIGPPVKKMKPSIQGATNIQAFSDSQKLRRLGLKRLWYQQLD